jgi:hypothetical protein
MSIAEKIEENKGNRERVRDTKNTVCCPYFEN